MTSPRPLPTLAPPPVQGLAVAYFSPLMSPTPVATRRPQPSKTEDTINAFLRVESGGGAMCDDQIFYEASVLIQGYSPNTQESTAEQITAIALGHGGNAQGAQIVHPSTEITYYVAHSELTVGATKVQDPEVNLVRFVGMVTWRIQGRPL